jgi:hypothetical protein
MTETNIAPPKPVAPAAVTPTTPLTAPPAPATSPHSVTRTGGAPPADFPRAVTPPNATVAAPEVPVIQPATPTPPPPPTSVARTPLPLLTLLTEPADGSTPLLLSNQNYLFVGGKIAPDSNIVTVRVNGLEAAIRNGEYQTQVTFPGPGDYLLLVEAISSDGTRTSYRRAITVVQGLDAVSPNKLEVRQRGGTAILKIVPGTRGLELARFTKTVEIRNAQGQLVNNWTMGGDESLEIQWNGDNANAAPLPPGRYELIYILSGEHGPLAWLRQPVELQQ